MLTLQILDGGDPFYRPLERRPIVLGSAPDTDVRLSAAGVAPAHARIEPIGDDDMKIVDLGAERGILVNGESVLQWRLGLGDRIEIGDAVVVVGQQVRRAATAEDVLERSVGPRAVTAARGGRSRTSRGRESRRVVYAVVALGLIGAVFLGYRATRSEGPPPYLAEIDQLGRSGRFDEARQLTAALRRDWAGSDDARRARVDAIEAEVDALDAAVQAGREELVAAAATTTRAIQIKRLRERQRQDPDGVDGRAARVLLGELDALRLEAPPRRDDGGMRLADSGQAPDSNPVPAPTVIQPRSVADAPVAESPVADASSSRLAAIRSTAESGDSRGALEMIDLAMASADQATADALRTLRKDIREQLETEAEDLLGRARSIAASGAPVDVERAIALLDAEGDRFPVVAGGNAIGFELVRLRGLLDASEQAVAADPLASLGELVDAARAAETVGEFATAAELVDVMLERLGDADPSYARELTVRRAELDLLLALERHLARNASTVGEFGLVTADGAVVTIEPDGERLRVAGGERNLPWGELLLPRVTAILAATDAPREASLAVAALAQRNGSHELAERVLLALSRDRREPAPEIAAMIARGRGERLETVRGYRVVDGAFVTVREIESREAAAKIARKLATAVNRDAKTRAAELDAILAEGPDQLDAVVVALNQQLDAKVAKVANHSFKKVWDGFAERHAELERRRASALQLIYDERRYFYPFRPPAVTGTKAAEYADVQSEIDGLVDDVEDLWQAKASPRRLPRALKSELERIDWLVEVLEGFGEPVEAKLAQIEWVRTLPRDGVLTLQTFASTVADRARLDEWSRIERYNAAKVKDLSSAEARQVAITNGYRALLGRRPLAVSPQLIEATRGHSEEMSRLGYFSHFSPVPGRKTPYERMNLAGYRHGVSENIAKHSSADSAHHGWTHSSGHHRNMLSASHSEFAVGNSGAYWTQNFGHGDSFRRDPDFPVDED